VKRFAARCVIMDEGRIVEEINAAGFDGVKHPASILLKEAVLPTLPGRDRGAVPQLVQG
jgi:nickel transport system ATP-binding protein